MTAKEIVKNWLIANGHDGLCTYGCGCGVDDLMPCEGFAEHCIPAMKKIATVEDVEQHPESVVGEEFYYPSEIKEPVLPLWELNEQKGRGASQCVEPQ